MSPTPTVVGPIIQSGMIAKVPTDTRDNVFDAVAAVIGVGAAGVAAQNVGGRREILEKPTWLNDNTTNTGNSRSGKEMKSSVNLSSLVTLPLSPSIHLLPPLPPGIRQRTFMTLSSLSSLVMIPIEVVKLITDFTVDQRIILFSPRVGRLEVFHLVPPNLFISSPPPVSSFSPTMESQWHQWYFYSVSHAVEYISLLYR
jgi:hypothetical protein